MIESLEQLEDAIEELKINEHCELRVSRDGEEFFSIIGLTCIYDENEKLICDFHLVRSGEPYSIN